MVVLNSSQLMQKMVRVACICLIAMSVSCETSEGTTGSAIQPYAENPEYWQYKGEPILLFGGSNRDNIFQWANEGTKLTDHLDLLQRCGGNYIRSAMNSREYFSSGYRWDVLAYPYAKVDGKYDLTRWNMILKVES